LLLFQTNSYIHLTEISLGHSSSSSKMISTNSQQGGLLTVFFICLAYSNESTSYIPLAYTNFNWFLVSEIDQYEFSAWFAFSIFYICCILLRINFIQIFIGKCCTPEKPHRGSEDCEDQGVIPRYTKRKSPQLEQSLNPKRLKSNQATSDQEKPFQLMKEAAVLTRQTSSSSATRKNTPLQSQNTWTLHGHTYVFDEKVKSSSLASLQFEVQLDRALQIANKCLTGSLEISLRETLFKDDAGGRMIIFSAEESKRDRTFIYHFDMFITKSPCPHSISPLTHPNFQAEITMSSGDTLRGSWELSLYRVTSASIKSKVRRDSITNIEAEILSHIKSLIIRVVIFIKSLVFLKSKLPAKDVDENTSISFPRVKRIVYELGGDKYRAGVVKFLVDELDWSRQLKNSSFATKNSALYTFPVI